jgi:iron complex transport system substrate-binding protein
VTHECDYPPAAREKPVMTRSVHDLSRASSHQVHDMVEHSMRTHTALYELDEAALAAARPDLILTQELCRVCAVGYEQVNEVARRLDGDVTVLSLEPTSVEGVLNAIQAVGAMTEAEDAAIEVVEELRERLRNVNEVVAGRRDNGFVPPRVAAVEWLDPPFASGHWVPEQVRLAGGWELLGAEGGRSVETTWGAVAEVDPAIIVLMPCGFDLATTVREWDRTPLPPGWGDLRAVRDGQLFAVDGSAYFSRPGPRVIDGIEVLAEIIDPAAFDGIAPADSWARLG